jgi:hypothetical protein
MHMNTVADGALADGAPPLASAGALAPFSPTEPTNDNDIVPRELLKCVATDLDEHGLPVIFSKFSFYELAAPESESLSPRALSIPETIGYASTDETDKHFSSASSLFDDDGFPNLGPSNIAPAANDASPTKDSDVQPSASCLDPCPKRRKTNVLEARAKAQAKPKAKPKAKPAATPPKKAMGAASATPPKASATVKAKETDTASQKADHNLLPLFAPKLVVTTEQNPRAQLCATAMLGSQKLRIFVCTATKNGWGPKFASHMQQIKEFIESGTVNKNECLELRHSLKEPVSVDGAIFERSACT